MIARSTLPLNSLATLFLAFAGLTLLPAPAARADGMAFPSVDASTYVVEAPEQQAVLWQRDGTWEIHIQPTFYREAVATAWVVPFPVRPEVSLGDPRLLDQLNRFTAPLFIEYCTEPSCGCGEYRDAAKGGGDGVLREDPLDVTVWETGSLGALDYAIVSAGDGDDLAAFLAAGGYHVPDTLEEAIVELKTEGVFFFVARLSEDVRPDVALPPVRFVLPGLEEPLYPLRLTRLGVADGDTLDLTLFVVFEETEERPGDGPAPSWALASHSWDRVAPDGGDRDAWAAAVEGAFAGDEDGVFLVEFGRRLADSFAWLVAQEDEYRIYDLYHDVIGYHWGLLETLMYGWDGDALDVPREPTDDLYEIADGGAWVFRLHARLPRHAMEQDLVLVQVTDDGERPSLRRAAATDPVFVTDEGSCYACDPCPDPDPELIPERDAGDPNPNRPDVSGGDHGGGLRRDVSGGGPARDDAFAGADAPTDGADGGDDDGLAVAGGGCQSGPAPADALVLAFLLAMLAVGLRLNRGRGR